MSAIVRLIAGVICSVAVVSAAETGLRQDRRRLFADRGLSSNLMEIRSMVSPATGKPYETASDFFVEQLGCARKAYKSKASFCGSKNGVGYVYEDGEMVAFAEKGKSANTCSYYKKAYDKTNACLVKISGKSFTKDYDKSQFTATYGTKAVVIETSDPVPGTPTVTSAVSRNPQNKTAQAETLSVTFSEESSTSVTVETAYEIGTSFEISAEAAGVEMSASLSYTYSGSTTDETSKSQSSEFSVEKEVTLEAYECAKYTVTVTPTTYTMDWYYDITFDAFMARYSSNYRIVPNDGLGYTGFVERISGTMNAIQGTKYDTNIELAKMIQNDDGTWYCPLD